MALSDKEGNDSNFNCFIYSNLIIFFVSLFGWDINWGYEAIAVHNHTHICRCNFLLDRIRINVMGFWYRIHLCESKFSKVADLVCPKSETWVISRKFIATMQSGDIGLTEDIFFLFVLQLAKRCKKISSLYFALHHNGKNRMIYD